MKLIDAIKVGQGRVEIPGCSRNDLPAFFKEMGYKVGAEIGVWKGRNTANFCAAGLKMFAIDPWLIYSDFHGKDEWQKDMQEEQNNFCKVAHWRLDRYKDRCVIIRKTSMEAAVGFEDNSLDFVYIDGHHGFKYVAEDIFEWSKKVRPGGVVSGHDYMDRTDWTCHVKSVVDAYVQAFGVKDWYIIGQSVDPVPSWMWVKP